MRFRATISGPLLALALASFVADASEQEPRTSAPLEGRIDALVNAYYEAGLFQGAIMVSMSDEVIYRGAVGLAQAQWRIPNDTRTRFKIASLGKALTAALVLQLADEKKIVLDDPIGRHVPAYRSDYGEQLTIRQLLAHSSGLPREMKSFLPYGYKATYSLDELVRYANSADLVDKPDSGFHYSNIGYNLLGAMIERVTGTSFETQLRTRILERAGMKDTGLVRHTTVTERLADGYDRLPGGELANAQWQDPSFAVAAGGLYSTVDDMFRWDQALYNDAIISPRGRELMFRAGLGGAGLGWAIGKYRQKDDPETYRLCLGFGGTNGFASAMTRLLDHHHAIVILGNIRQVPQQQMINDLTNLILGFDPRPPRKSPLDDVFGALIRKGQPDALELLQSLDPRPTAAEMNSGGYACLEAGRVGEAVALFELNLAAHPNYANGFDSLGEALERAGRARDALAAYRKALELDPRSSNPAARIKVLEARLKEDH